MSAGTGRTQDIYGVVYRSASDTGAAVVRHVRLRVGGMPLLARLTRRSAAPFHLTRQQQVGIQIKVVASIG